MIIVRIAISVRGNDDNTIEIIAQERADTNDAEREIAAQFQEVMRMGLEGLRDRLPAGEVTLTVTEKED